MPLQLLWCLRANGSASCSLRATYYHPRTLAASTFSAFFLVDGPAVIFIDGYPVCQVDGARHSASLGCQGCPVITLHLCCARPSIPSCTALEWGQVSSNVTGLPPRSVVVYLQGAVCGTATFPARFLSVFPAPSNGALLRPGCPGCCVLNSRLVFFLWKPQQVSGNAVDRCIFLACCCCLSQAPRRRLNMGCACVLSTPLCSLSLSFSSNYYFISHPPASPPLPTQRPLSLSDSSTNREWTRACFPTWDGY